MFQGSKCHLDCFRAVPGRAVKDTFVAGAVPGRAVKDTFVARAVPGRAVPGRAVKDTFLILRAVNPIRWHLLP